MTDTVLPSAGPEPTAPQSSTVSRRRALRFAGGAAAVGTLAATGLPAPAEAVVDEFVEIAKRPISLRDYDGIDWTGATDSAAAVQVALDAAGPGGVIDVDLRDGTIRCDQTLTLGAFQRLRGSAQNVGGGTDRATFDFSHLPVNGVAIDASAGSCQIEDVHLVGPGSENTASKGIRTIGTGGSAITLERVTVQRFGDAIYLANQYYASLSDVETIYNRVGLRLTGCYNVNVYRPKMFCGGTDSYQGSGIITNTVRALNVWGGSIEGYGTIVGAPNDAGIVVGSGSQVNVSGVYFESPGEEGNCVAIDATTATEYVLNVFGCEVYLPEHRAFIDAEGSSTAGTINAGGNKFECHASTTPAGPIGYLLGVHPGLIANIGLAQEDSWHGVTVAGAFYTTSGGGHRAGWSQRIPRGAGAGAGFVFDGGKRVAAPSSAGEASIRLPHGVAPTNPQDGDMWTTSAGLFVRIGGVTRKVTTVP